LACRGEQSTEPSDTDTEPVDEGCAEDDECGLGQICEQPECLDGDRDNGFDVATAIFQETPVESEIVPEGDVDYFAYASAGDEWIRIETSPDEAESGLETVVAVHTAGGAVYAYMDDYPTGDVTNYDSVLYAYLPTAGTWYITVQDASSFFEDADLPTLTGSYSIQVRPFTRFTAESDAADDPSATVTLENDTTIYAAGVHLEVDGDSDFLSITVPWERGPIEIWGHEETPGSDAVAEVKIWDESGTLLADKLDLGPAGTAYYFDTLASTYTIEAADGEGQGGDDHWYVLYFRTREAEYYGLAWDDEPNETTELAQELETTELENDNGDPYERATVTGFMDVDGDEDWFSVEAFEDAYVSVWCSTDQFGSQLDAAIDVYGPDGELLDSGLDGNDLAPDLTNLGRVAEGDVTFRLYTEKGDVTAGPSAYYYCSFYQTPFEVVE
jgi:hypothetical protein